MKSLAQNHYPRYIFRDGIKLLWNPILKKAFVDRPEERVRLQLIEYLILEAGFSSSRISFESPVNLPRDKSASRTDVVCFDKDFKPFLLIECKAPEIELTEKACVQIARYNQKVGAPLLLISNGLEDFWFSSKKDESQNVPKIPSDFSSKKELTTDFDYWCKHGFAGSKSNPKTRKWILESCEFLFNTEKDSFPRYFKFEGAPPEFYMANYYKVFETENLKKLAVSLTSTPFGATKLNCVLNKNGINTALLSCSLDLVAAGDVNNTFLRSESGISQINLSDEIGFNIDTPLNQQFLRMSDFLSKF